MGTSKSNALSELKTHPRFNFDAAFLKKVNHQLMKNALKDRPSTACIDDLEFFNLSGNDIRNRPSSATSVSSKGIWSRSSSSGLRIMNTSGGLEEVPYTSSEFSSFLLGASVGSTKHIAPGRVSTNAAKSLLALNDFRHLPRVIQVSWELLYTDFVKKYDYRHVLELESNFKSLKFPQMEYGDTTEFLYDAILFMSQYYQHNTLLFNAMLNLVAELTNRRQVNRYFPEVLESPRKILLALVFASNSTMDMSLSFSFFALTLQLITSFDAKAWPLKAIYLSYFPKAFGGHNTFTERVKRKRYELAYKNGTIGKQEFEDLMNNSEVLVESDSMFIAHLVRSIWLMAVLSMYQKAKDTNEAKDMWDLIAEEIKYMAKKPGFKFKALYQFVAIYYRVMDHKMVDNFLTQMKTNSYRPMSAFEICAHLIEPCKYFNIFRYCKHLLTTFSICFS